MQLITDGNVPIQLFVADPGKSQVNASMTGTITFKVGTGGTVNITGWKVIKIVPTADSTYYFNDNNTKTYPLYSKVESLIPVKQLAAGEYITFVLGAATASVQGM